MLCDTCQIHEVANVTHRTRNINTFAETFTKVAECSACSTLSDELSQKVMDKKLSLDQAMNQSVFA